MDFCSEKNRHILVAGSGPSVVVLSHYDCHKTEMYRESFLTLET